MAIAGIDTRKLTLSCREGCPGTAASWLARTTSSAHRLARSFPGLGRLLDLAKVVSVKEPYEWTQNEWKLGEGYGKLDKPEFRGGWPLLTASSSTSLRMLAERGCKVTVLPAQASAAARCTWR